MEIIISTIIAAAAYLSKSLIFEPYLRYKATVGKVDNRLKYYSNLIANPGTNPEKARNAADVLRDLSCEFEANYKQLFGFSEYFLYEVLNAPLPIDAAQVAAKLIGLSNSLDDIDQTSKNSDDLAKIRNILDIPELARVESLSDK